MSADKGSTFVRAPLQERSRRSLDKVVDAAVALLVETRSDPFTLAEVARRSGVSIGSIYARVGSKDDLLRAAQAPELARMSVETARVQGRISRAGAGIPRPAERGRAPTARSACCPASPTTATRCSHLTSGRRTHG